MRPPTLTRIDSQYDLPGNPSQEIFGAIPIVRPIGFKFIDAVMPRQSIFAAYRTNVTIP
jgi:hypothetical protein